MIAFVKRCFEFALEGDPGIDVICNGSPVIISVTKINKITALHLNK